MASRYTLELPDGRKLTVEADSEEAAMSGAQQWFAANPKQPDAPKGFNQADAYNAMTPEQQRKLDPASGTRGLMDFMTDGITMGFADKARAGMRSMVTGMPYDAAIKETRRETASEKNRIGGAATVAEIGGGVATGLTAAGAGLTAARFIPQATAGGKRLLALMGAGAVDGAAMGALSGAGNTDDGEYTRRMAEQAAIGGSIGGIAPAVVAGAGKAVQPAIDAVASRVAPEAFAKRLAGRAIERSGQPIDMIRSKLQQAADDGVPNYTAVDAMGDGGARALNTITRGSSPSASRAKEFLDARQFDQANRMEGYIRDGLGARNTAQQLVDKLKGVRTEKANLDYDMARATAGPVDVTKAIAALDTAIPPTVSGQVGTKGISESGPVAQIVAARRLLTNEPVGGVPSPSLAPQAPPPGLTPLQRAQWFNNPPAPPAPPAPPVAIDDFNRALLARHEMDKAMEAGGVVAGLMKPARRELASALRDASPQMRQADRTFANISSAIEAVDTGKALAARGVTQDTADTFARMAPQEAGAARTGYADKMIERLQRGAEGVNASRPMTSEKFVQDLPAVAKPGRADKLQRQINREQEMFATRATATGGSNTAQNMSDLAAAAGGGYAGADYMSGGMLPGGEFAALLAARRGIGRLPLPDKAAEELARALLSQNANNVASIAAKTIKGREISEQSVASLARALGLMGISALQPSSP